MHLVPTRLQSLSFSPVCPGWVLCSFVVIQAGLTVLLNALRAAEGSQKHSRWWAAHSVYFIVFLLHCAEFIEICYLLVQTWLGRDRSMFRRYVT